VSVADLSAVTFIEACAGVLPHVGRLEVSEHLNGAILTPQLLTGTNRLAAAQYQIGSPDSFPPIWLPAAALAWVAKLKLDAQPKRNVSPDWMAAFRVSVETALDTVTLTLYHRPPGADEARIIISHVFEHCPQERLVAAYPPVEKFFANVAEVGRITAPRAVEEVAGWIRRHRHKSPPPLVVSAGPTPNVAWVFSADRLAVAVAVRAPQ